MRKALSDSWFLARTDFTRLIASRESLLWTFVMPFLFMYFIGVMTRGFGPGPTDNPDGIAVLVDKDAGYLADHYLRRIEERNFRVTRVGADQFSRPGRRLAIPFGFTESVRAGRLVELDFYLAPGTSGGEYEAMRLKVAAYAALADLIATTKREGEITAPGLERLRSEPRLITVKTQSAGRRITIPTGFNQSVPGTMVMFTMLALFTGGAATLLIERDGGLLRRLASAPISRGSVVLGKSMARLGMGLLQVALALVAGTFLFRVDWGQNLATLVVVLFGYAALLTVLSMLLANFSRTMNQAIALGVISSNALAALGGCWWPAEILPGWARTFAMTLPTGWAMDAVHKLVHFGAPPERVLPHIAAFALTTLLAGWCLARTFRFQS